MIIGRVIGNLIATQKNKELEGHKLLIVQPLNLDFTPKGNQIISLDRVSAGEGDLVLLMREGGSARIIYNNKKIPIQAVIVGIIDDIEIEK